MRPYPFSIVGLEGGGETEGTATMTAAPAPYAMSRPSEDMSAQPTRPGHATIQAGWQGIRRILVHAEIPGALSPAGCVSDLCAVLDAVFVR